MVKNKINNHLTNYFSKGLSFLELLVAMFLVAVAVLGLMRVQQSMLRGSVDNSQRTIGVFLANEVLDRIQANNNAVAAYQTALNAPQNCAAPVQSCVESACSETELAQRDIWEIMCQGGATGIANLTITLTCAGVCSSGMVTTLTVAWDEKFGTNTVARNVNINGIL